MDGVVTNIGVGGFQQTGIWPVRDQPNWPQPDKTSWRFNPRGVYVVFGEELNPALRNTEISICTLYYRVCAPHRSPQFVCSGRNSVVGVYSAQTYQWGPSGWHLDLSVVSGEEDRVTVWLWGRPDACKSTQTLGKCWGVGINREHAPRQTLWRQCWGTEGPRLGLEVRVREDGGSDVSTRHFPLWTRPVPQMYPKSRDSQPSVCLGVPRVL